MGMDNESVTSSPRPRRRVLWSGLLLGGLLTTFVAILAYVAYLFLAWGQTAVAQAPDLPPLALPRLVRPAAEQASEASAAGLALFQPASRRQQEIAPATNRTTILIIGVDARPKQTFELTDSIIVLTMNPQTGSAGMLSLPRDLKIRPTTFTQAVKINMVYQIGVNRGTPGGGAALLGDVVTEMIGYPIDYYIKINFEGFKQIVDLIGGVDINVTKEIYDDKYPDDNYGYEPPVHFLPGLQHMDGATALKYARTRHADNDYMRAARQQQVIMAIKDKIMQPGQLEALLPRLPRLATAMANSVQTDMPVDKAIALARALDKINLDNPTRVVIDTKMGTPGYEDPAQGGLGSFLVPDMNKVRAAADAIFSDALPEISPEETTRQAVQAEAARIIVLNGTAERGVAAKTQSDLITAGFNVIAVGNAETADYAETTLVTHDGQTPATVQALRDRFGITDDRVRAEPANSAVDVILIIGQDQVGTATAGQ